MSIRYFSKWLQDEERSYADWKNSWAWLDLNVTDPPPGVIYLTPKPIIPGSEASTDQPFLLGRGSNFELSEAENVDGGSLPFIIRRSTVYIFNYTPLILLVLGIITNSIQLAICCRLRNKLPAVAFLSVIAIADLTCITLGAGRMAIDRLFSVSIDHLHPWSCKIRNFLLASALDLSVWLVPLGLCELWRPASRIIIYATVMSLLLNLHNLVTRGWQVQGDFGQEPIMNNCGFSFPDAKIFWLHIHPIVSVIINVIGPTLASVLLVLTLSFQGRCHAAKKTSEKTKKLSSSKILRVNLLVLFALLAAIQATLLAPTAVLSAMELFLDFTVHPSMRALVFFAQLLNCTIKLPFIFMAAPQLCPAMADSTMGFYGEKRPKDKNEKRKRNLRNMEASESDSGGGGDQSEIEDRSSLVTGGSKHSNHCQKNETNHAQRQHYQKHEHHQTRSHKTQKTFHQNEDGSRLNPKKKTSSSKKGNRAKYAEVIAADQYNEAALLNEFSPIDAGKQLAQATLSRSAKPPQQIHPPPPLPPPAPQSLALIANEQPLYYQTAQRPSHYSSSSNQHQSVGTMNNHYHQQQHQQYYQQYPTLNSATASHRHASLVTAAAQAVAQGGTLPSMSSITTAQQQQQIYWRNEPNNGTESNRKIYV